MKSLFHSLYIKRRSDILVFLPAILFTACKSIETPIDRRLTSNQTHKEVLYVTDKKPRPRIGRSYHWFKSQKVFSSQNDYAGTLLHGEYTKYYYTNEVAVKGKLKNGLKKGKWISWHKNGMVTEVHKWKSGRRHGKFIVRDSLGNTTLLGSYKKGQKNGVWAYPMEGDTIRYGKDGKPEVKMDKNLKKPKLLKKLFPKKADKNEKRDKRARKKIESKRANDSTVVRKDKKPKRSGKSNFFGRLFKKKDKKTDD